MKKILLSLLLAVVALFTVTACGKKPTPDPTPSQTANEPEGLKSAKAYLKNMYRTVDEVTTSSFSRVAKVTIGEDVYPVEWTVSFASSDDAVKSAVVIAKNADETAYDITITQIDVEVVYTLTATISDSNNNKATLEYNHKVPKFKVNTYEEYVKAESNTPMIVEGIVTAVVSKSNGASTNCVFLQAQDGAFYVYKLDSDPVTDGIQIGMKVRATGKKDTYSGTYEVVSASLTVLDKTINKVEPIDLTEAAAKASALTDAALVDIQSSYVTIKNVKLDTRSDSDVAGGYYPFTFTGADGKTLRSYLRISSSTCALDKAGQTTMINNHKPGYQADVTGLVSLFNGAFYLVPADTNAISNLTLPELNDADAVAAEKEALSIKTLIEKSGDVVLPTAGTAYTKVGITWEISDNTVAVLGADGKTLTVTCGETEVTVTLTATLKAGEATATKSFEVKIASKNVIWLTAEEALVQCAALEAGGQSEKVYIYGTILDDPTAEYCNFNLGTEANKLLVYGLENAEGKKYGSKKDIAELPIVKGQLVYISGYLKKYVKGDTTTLEVVNAVLETTPEAGKSNATAFDAAKAIEMCGALDGAKKEKTTERYYFVGTITDDPTAEYCNFHFKAGEQEIIAYGLWTSDGSQRYGSKRDIAELPVAKGDVVVLYSLLQNYNGTLQFAEARFVKVTKGSTTPVDPTPVDPTPVDPTPVEPVNVLKETLVFDFSTAPAGEEITDAKATLEKYASVANVIVSASATKAFEGNGAGGGKPNATGLIKFGTSKVQGLLEIKFAEGTKVTKVVVNCHDFYALSEAYPTTKNELSVNGVKLANPYNAEATPENLTFEFAATNVVTIAPQGRIVIYSITIYVEA